MSQFSSDRDSAAGPMSTFMPQNIDAHPMEFTGSGGESFRGWIVNVLLSIVTLGIYTPWARRRTAQYFYSHPLFALALVWFGVFFGMQILSPELADVLQEVEDEAANPKMPSFTPVMGALLLLGLVLTVLCFIRLEYNYKSLLVLKAQVGAEKGRWKPVYMDFVKVWLATVAVFVLTVVGFSVLIGVLAGSSIALFAGQSSRMGLWMILVIIVSIIAGIFMLILASAPARAHPEARMFQLMWNNIGVSHVARFKCHLKSSSYVGLRIKNMLLTLLTLGLYRPFARVSEYRMKCESVTLHVKGGVEQVAGAMVRQQQGGLGDALADAAGLDLIG